MAFRSNVHVLSQVKKCGSLQNCVTEYTYLS